MSGDRQRDGVGAARRHWYARSDRATLVNMSATLRHLQVVARHGDRLPIFAPSQGCGAAEAAEARAWAARARGGGGGGGAPWGQLTALGAAQAKARGAQLRTRYAAFVDRAPRVAAAASNYARTQISCEELLSGLLAPSRAEPVAVRVAPPADCPLAAFDRGPALYAVQQRVYETLPWYASEERRLRAVAGVLTRAIPYFRTSRFMWIKAFDVLTTHAAHGFPLPPLVAHPTIAHTVADHLFWRFTTLLGHAQPLQLASGDLLAQLAAATAAAAAVQDSAATGGRHGSSAPVADVSVHCGHDVTILPLLLALAETLDQPQRYYGLAQQPTVQAIFSDGGQDQLSSREALLQALAWPGYAAAVCFELHHEASGGDGAGGDAGRWLLHWRFFDDALQPDVSGGGAAAAAAAVAAPPWHIHWDGGGSGTDPEDDGDVAAALRAAGSHAPRRRATQLHGCLSLAGWLQLAADVAGGRLGRPLPAAAAPGAHAAHE